MTTEKTKDPAVIAPSPSSPAQDDAGRLPRRENGQSYVPGYTPPVRAKWEHGVAGAALMISSHAPLLDRWSDAVAFLASRLPARTTLRQALAFVMLARSLAAKRRMTIGDLRETGQDAWGEPLIGSSIAKSYQLFLEPSKALPDALGWLTQVPDEDDRRVKRLVLTPLGIEIVAQIVIALRSQAERTDEVHDEEFPD